ncbi:MAG: hypothetical protein ABI137_00555 [Antricoccus sp.]
MTLDLIWYAAYGSNLSQNRLMHYLAGGQPQSAQRAYAGARDPRRPRATKSLLLPGEVYFAWQSTTWGGGVAFYDPTVLGASAGRAYLITASQFADIAAQEMHRPSGTDLDLAPFGSGTTSLSLGAGRYETLQLICRLDDIPVLTFTSAQRHRRYNSPVGPYLKLMARGIKQSHDWSPDRIEQYLLSRPGVRPNWNSETLRLAIDDDQ